MDRRLDSRTEGLLETTTAVVDEIEGIYVWLGLLDFLAIMGLVFLIKW